MYSRLKTTKRPVVTAEEWDTEQAARNRRGYRGSQFVYQLTARGTTLVWWDAQRVGYWDGNFRFHYDDGVPFPPREFWHELQMHGVTWDLNNGPRRF